MKYLTQSLVAVVSSTLLFACSSVKEPVDKNQTTALQTEQDVYQFNRPVKTDHLAIEHLNSDPLAKNINFYIRGMMQDLVSNLQYVNASTPVAVTSFVYLDGPEDQSSLLGNQITQSLLHEIHKVGIPVLDHKVTDYLRVTEQGDFIYTKNFLELSPKLPIKYVFTGNIVKHQGGYLVNARVVGITSKAIVASAQRFIPHSVAHALLDSSPTEAQQPEVEIIQG